MNRTKIENVLMDMGIPVNIKGFMFIADAVEYINEHKNIDGITKELYPEIAKKRNTTPSKVERAIRHAFGVARSERGNYETVEKYIGFMNCANFNSLMMLYKKINQECENLDTNFKTENEIKRPDSPITTLEIREIFKQELRNVLNELKGVTT